MVNTLQDQPAVKLIIVLRSANKSVYTMSAEGSHPTHPLVSQSVLCAKSRVYHLSQEIITSRH